MPFAADLVVCERKLVSRSEARDGTSLIHLGSTDGDEVDD